MKTILAVVIAYIMGIIAMCGFFYKIPILSTATAIIGLVLGLMIGDKK